MSGAIESKKDPKEAQVPTLSHDEFGKMVVATTDAEAESLRRDWCSLLDRSRPATPDADPDFFLDTYRSVGEDARPHVVVFREEGTASALIVAKESTRSLPCRVGRLSLKTPSLRCLEIVCGGLVTNGRAASLDVVTDYLDRLLADGSIHVLYVLYLPEAHELAPALREGLHSSFRVVERPEASPIRYLVDPDTGEAVEANSAKTRSSFRRQDRLFVKAFDDEVELRVFDDSDGVNELLRAADAITSAGYQAALGTGVQDSTRWRSTLQALARSGHLRGFVLVGKQTPVAYILGSMYHRQFQGLATGFDPAYRELSPGTVITNRVIEHLRQENGLSYNFGSKPAKYKSLYANDVKRSVIFSLYAANWRPKVASYMQQSSMFASSSLKRLAKRLGIHDAVIRHWHRRLERSRPSRKPPAGSRDG